MSLTSHIDDRQGPVREFLESLSPSMDTVVGECRQKLSEADMIVPSVPFPRHAYRLIGMAFDYRVRYYFENYPSYDTVAFEGALKLLPDALNMEEDAHSVYPLLWDFFGSVILSTDSEIGAVDRVVTELQPPRRRLEPAQEGLLARYCFGLAYFEQIFRGRSQNSPILRPEPLQSADTLLSLPEDAWVDDLSALSWAFHDDFDHLFTGKRKTHLNPTFDGSRDVGGADADLIVDGCLIDLKVVTQLHMDDCILQLLGYALLDYSDKYQIRDVALYFARHKLMLRWPLEELLSQLSNGKSQSLEDLRRQFKDVLSTLDR